jgi:hypothetical protein
MNNIKYDGKVRNFTRADKKAIAELGIDVQAVEGMFTDGTMQNVGYVTSIDGYNHLWTPNRLMNKVHKLLRERVT